MTQLERASNHEALFFLFTIHPTAVTCPTCGSEPRAVCRTSSGTRVEPHKKRRTVARASVPAIMAAAEALANYCAKEEEANFIDFVEDSFYGDTFAEKIALAKRLIHRHLYGKILTIECKGDQALIDKEVTALFDPDSP